MSNIETLEEDQQQKVSASPSWSAN